MPYKLKCNNLVRLIATPILVTVVCTSCGEPAQTSPETRSADLVFNDLNVEQIRGQMASARTQPTFSKAERIKYKTAALARAAGTVNVQVQTWNGDLDKCVGGASRGSGTLTSATRLVTAHHVIAGTDFAAPGDSLVVGFGGKCEQGSHSSCDGMFVADDNYGRDEENPLLANRLFQLGLDEWARNSTTGGVNAIGARNTLRNWIFEFDDIDDQPFGRAGSRRDVAILEATRTKNSFNFEFDDESSEFYTPSGPFSIDKPAMFFGQVMYDDWADGPANGTEPTDLYELHYNTWPDDTAETVVPLISNPGFTDAKGVSCASNPKACSLDSNQQWIHDPVGYQHCIATTLDGREGSSGGALAYQPKDKVGHFFLRARGLDQGCAAPTADSCKLWDLQNSVQLEPERPEANWQSIFTTADEDVKRWADRDKSYGPNPDPFNPVPHQLESDGTPKCTGDKDPQTELCRSFSKPESNDVWGNPPDIDELPIQTYDGSQDSTTPEEHRSVRFLCNYSGFRQLGPRMRTHAGIALGLVGTATKPDANDGVVGSLGIICGPWSAIAWSDNWRFLMINGRQMKQGLDAAGDFVPRAMLSWALPLSYEVRVDPNISEPYPRPISMKMCPPNYFLNGVWVNEQDGILAGIAALQCETPDGDERVESLDAPSAKYGNYTMAGRKYPLDQRIGTPGTGQTLIRCKDPDLRAVMGFVGTSSHDKPISSVHLECGPHPQPTP